MTKYWMCDENKILRPQGWIEHRLSSGSNIQGLMPILETSRLEELLACPRCRTSLRKVADGYACTNDSCQYAGDQMFAIVGSWPILVDFDDSILRADAVLGANASSAIRRPSQQKLRQFTKSVLFGAGSVTRRNVSSFLSRLKGSTDSPVVLIIGGGTVGSGMSQLYEDRDVHLVSFDIYGTTFTQFVADAHRIPMTSDAVDGVVIQAVLEHVLEPWRVVSEIHRVLKSRGLVYAETPFLQQVHEGAYDFTRFTESGHRYLFKHFKRYESGALTGPGTQLLWTIDHAVRSLSRSRLLGKLTKLLFFWLRFLDLVASKKHMVDTASGVYFMGEKTDRAITPQQIVSHYQGAQ